MSEQFNWGGSRWEGTRVASRWHFDTTRPPEPGADSFTYVGRFTADFADVVARYLPKADSVGWGTRNKEKIPGELYTASAEEADLIRAGADPKMEIYARVAAEDEPVFNTMAAVLGIDDPQIKFHNQKTGQVLVWHIDNFAARSERDNSFKVTDLDTNPEQIRRFAIMLADWQPGQIWQIGNATWTHWKSGDCITWEWQDMPHATCNMGWWDRPLCQITGYVTPKTRSILNNPGQTFTI